MHPDDSVRCGNRLRYNNSSNPFYEIYYLKLVDPQAKWSFWARYTLLIPKSGRATANLWGIYHEPDGESIALKRTLLLADTDIFHRERFIQMGDSFLTLASAVGGLENSDHHLRWDFTFEDPTLSSRLFPYRWMYSFPFPKTKFLEPRLTTFVSGNLHVDRRALSLEHVRAHQAHIWGTHYAKRWVWGHCDSFIGSPGTVFEGLVAQIGPGPLSLPPLPLFCLIYEGKTYWANGFMNWVTNKSTHDLHHWQFEARDRAIKIVGRVKRRGEDIVGVEYVGPFGEKRYCHNTMMADMELDIFKKNGKTWEPTATLRSEKTTAFETVELKPHPQVKFVL